MGTLRGTNLYIYIQYIYIYINNIYWKKEKSYSKVPTGRGDVNSQEGHNTGNWRAWVLQALEGIAHLVFVTMENGSNIIAHLVITFFSAQIRSALFSLDRCCQTKKTLRNHHRASQDSSKKVGFSNT